MISLCVSCQGRPGADGGRGAPGETGAKVSFIQQLLQCYMTCKFFILYCFVLVVKSTHVLLCEYNSSILYHKVLDLKE